ncbi:aconitate hydratase AcnA [Pueribacillus theae]|uniref:aconitate hydratase AcnA n=1 Tax=Pueribacillus theae TaxID=2171751 RepID=UPI001F0C8715|nr:aconitate hydratase AcnA [Pueribacillus theae]
MEKVNTSYLKSNLFVHGKKYKYFSLQKLEELGFNSISQLPYTIRILLEGVIRQLDENLITSEHVYRLANWLEDDKKNEIPFMPSRILWSDMSGGPAMVDLAGMRTKIFNEGGDPGIINPLIPSDLVIDHSVMIDKYGTKDALKYNSNKDLNRNYERYRFLRWSQNAFENFQIIPPSTGIMHQVNLEYLATVTTTKAEHGEQYIFPDSIMGVDSHSPMINSLGVLGWGVGGIDAEAGMLGQPQYFLTPQVVGVEITGNTKEGVTVTDIALTITQLLRKKGVVEKFVEFYGEGLSNLTVPDRATISNMTPEYGATVAFFPVDEETLKYLRLTGRNEQHIKLVEEYYKSQGLFRTTESEVPTFSDTLTLDLSTIEPTISGPRRPQDKIELSRVKDVFNEILRKPIENGGYGLSEEEIQKEVEVQHRNGSQSILLTGSVVIAAITSCTNTSNPSVMVGAGILAKKAVEKGLRTPAFVKTSLAPGSTVVTQYLRNSDLLKYLEKLGFFVSGYGCTTCMGNSGPLPSEVSKAISENNLHVSSVLSGNRNFEGRIHELIKSNYLCSPPLVVAYAIAGTLNIDFQHDPLGYDNDGKPVFLKDIWPTSKEIQEQFINITPDLFRSEYSNIFMANKEFNDIDIPEGKLYEWGESSTYIQEPPFFKDVQLKVNDTKNIRNARTLALLGDNVTTDHISPVGGILKQSPAGQYLITKGVRPLDFNSYGSRRGNINVMIRGTFANVRLRNHLAEGKEGGYTTYIPTNELMSIYEASCKYKETNTPLIILAGKEYGMGSARDWAAKGTYLLGVKAVIAESFERIHRSNLVGMGVLPLQFKDGEGWKELGITGSEKFDILGLEGALNPGAIVTVSIERKDGTSFNFGVIVRLDSYVEIDYYRNGGLLHKVYRQFAGQNERIRG